jgi:hypothetical protein
MMGQDGSFIYLVVGEDDERKLGFFILAFTEDEALDRAREMIRKKKIKLVSELLKVDSIFKDNDDAIKAMTEATKEADKINLVDLPMPTRRRP